MITPDKIRRLRDLDKRAKKAPWYSQGAGPRGKRVYRLGEAEEDLIIEMRNSISELLDLAEEHV